MFYCASVFVSADLITKSKGGGMLGLYTSWGRVYLLGGPTFEFQVFSKKTNVILSYGNENYHGEQSNYCEQICYSNFKSLHHSLVVTACKTTR